MQQRFPESIWPEPASDVPIAPTDLKMEPSPGTRLLRFVGDRLAIRIFTTSPTDGLKAFLRTTIGQDEILRSRAMAPMTRQRVLPGADWRNLPMCQSAPGVFEVSMTLTEPGFFWAKPYFMRTDGTTFWPPGENIGLSVHGAHLRAGNTIYCAFVRLFGQTMSEKQAINPVQESQFKALDDHDYTVIPPSGTFRQLKAHLPHIMDKLGCRFLHLLPVNPTPTTMARMGRYGSPYAGLDLTGIDPALVEFDKKTTGIDQFCELTRAVHHKGGKVLLDLVINHTGWGSKMFEHRPDWFVRKEDGTFVSPGAWGVTWEDLVKLDHRHTDLWSYIAEAFLTWCRRGVDGFRCDAGYMIPLETWKAITARVRDIFPDTVFLLEGLGGAFELTENLITRGRMQWAYSELFQNYTAHEVAAYNDHAMAVSESKGLLIHFSETHDNNRVAVRGKKWALLRHRLCGLLSHRGGFGFTCGGEWLATEKVDVHQATGLNWNSPDNIVDELATLNHLLKHHPAFFDHADISRQSGLNDPVYLLKRVDQRGEKMVLVMANMDMQKAQTVVLGSELTANLGQTPCDLLGEQPSMDRTQDGQWRITVEPGGVHCLAPTPMADPEGLFDYTTRRAQYGLAITTLAKRFAPEEFGPCDWEKLACLFAEKPFSFLGAVDRVDPIKLKQNICQAVSDAMNDAAYNNVVTWRKSDINRLMVVPFGHWLLIENESPFRIKFFAGALRYQLTSVAVNNNHVAMMPPGTLYDEVKVELDSQNLEGFIKGQLLFQSGRVNLTVDHPTQGTLLLTNERGGMLHLPRDLTTVTSKYNAVLAVNEHNAWPVDRQILVKRVRAWMVVDGFSQPLDGLALNQVTHTPFAKWSFSAGACGGAEIPVTVEAVMPNGRNATVMRFAIGQVTAPKHTPLHDQTHMDLIIRVDLEDRSFHSDSRFTPNVEAQFRNNVTVNDDQRGFTMIREGKQPLHVFCREGVFTFEPEWDSEIPHKEDESRGQRGIGTGYSPGWFRIDLRTHQTCSLIMDADAYTEHSNQPLKAAAAERAFIDAARTRQQVLSQCGDTTALGQMLASAISAYVVKRDEGKTIIAGYPWFLDWGRDTLICARGLIAAGRTEEVAEILRVFGRFEEGGTLPNCIHGDDVSNRDTSDAPLWYAVVAEDLAGSAIGTDIYNMDTGNGRTVAEVLFSIAAGIETGTPNGITLDRESGLVFSPSHFTWMDTNYPAGTPRAGYPIEIQALWIRLLRLLVALCPAYPELNNGPHFETLLGKAETTLVRYYDEQWGYLADNIVCATHAPIRTGEIDDALRPNALLAVAFGVVKGVAAKRTVMAAARHLIIPGAIRSLAPLSTKMGHPVFDQNGLALNDPHNPYFGKYEGDEDTRRKPAYHNGTAWTWLFPVFCEALAEAFDHEPEAVAAARSYLMTVDRLLTEGCLGHLPEIVDGDFPHRQRGCDAQAWGVTEAYRVWRKLNK